MNKIRRLVIADDLTGANDTGVHFLSENESVEVLIDAQQHLDSSFSVDADTLVINTSTRNVTPEESAVQVAGYLKTWLPYSPREIYKKIDSTLRGNIGSEIDALMTTSQFRIACVAPAVPRNGRTTVDGICYVHGVPLDETEFAKDPFSPVESSDIREIIAKQTSRKSGILSLNIIRNETAYALSTVRSMIADGVEIFITDAETREDLLRTREIFSTLDEKVLYVGAAGFFHAISTFLKASTHMRLRKESRILFVAGSMMETSKQQIEWLIDKGLLNRTFSVIASKALLDERKETDRIITELSEEFRRTSTVLLHTDRDTSEVAANAQNVADVLSRVTRAIMVNERIDALVVIGGETAMSILKRLGVNSLRLADELLPAVPVAYMNVPGDGEQVIFISKAGSYGERNVLEGILNYLNSIKQELK